MARVLLLLVIGLTLSQFAFADNSIRIIPDSTGKYAILEISRNHPTEYKVAFQDEANRVIEKKSVIVNDQPTRIFFTWETKKPGIYYMVLKHKREKIKIMFMKNPSLMDPKEKVPAVSVDK